MDDSNKPLAFRSSRASLYCSQSRSLSCYFHPFLSSTLVVSEWAGGGQELQALQRYKLSLNLLTLSIMDLASISESCSLNNSTSAVEKMKFVFTKLCRLCKQTGVFLWFSNLTPFEEGERLFCFRTWEWGELFGFKELFWGTQPGQPNVDVLCELWILLSNRLGAMFGLIF